MTKKIKKFTLYFSTGLMILTGGIKIKLCKDESKTFTKKVISYTDNFTTDDFLVAAHRGFSSLEIENTLNSFSLANSKDYIDYIEIDIRLTKDKKLVLSHNNCLLTLQNKSVNISSKKLCELQEMDFYCPNNPLLNINLSGDEINEDILKTRRKKLYPKKYQLTSLLECINEQLNKKLILDLKCDTNYSKFIKELEKEISDIDINNIIFQSSNYEFLAKLQEKHPEYNTSIIIKNNNDLKYIDCFDNVCIKKTLLTEDTINTLLDKDKNIFIWTINNPSEINSIADKLGDNYKSAIYISDYPDVIATCLHEKQLQKEKN